MQAKPKSRSLASGGLTRSFARTIGSACVCTQAIWSSGLVKLGSVWRRGTGSRYRDCSTVWRGQALRFRHKFIALHVRISDDCIATDYQHQLGGWHDFANNLLKCQVVWLTTTRNTSTGSPHSQTGCSTVRRSHDGRYELSGVASVKTCRGGASSLKQVLGSALPFHCSHNPAFDHVWHRSPSLRKASHHLPETSS